MQDGDWWDGGRGGGKWAETWAGLEGGCKTHPKPIGEAVP